MPKAQDILVALCDGHGQETAGKRTPIFPEGGFMKENTFNRGVVNFLDIELKRCGFKTLLVAPTDKDTPLAERASLANSKGADFYISVHANANTGNWGEWGGLETLTGTSVSSKRFSQLIHKQLLKGTPMRDRGVKDGGWLYLAKHTKMPFTLVECGFMDNLKEAHFLNSTSYQKECAVEIAKGICEGFGVPFIEDIIQKPLPVAPKPTPKPDSKKLYKVQVGAFRGKRNADSLEAKLKALGFSVFTKKVGEFHKVQCGAFANKTSAEALQTEIKKKGYDSQIVFE